MKIISKRTLKTNFVVIAISFLILFSCGSRTSQNNIDVLFKRWKIDYVEMNGQKVDEITGEKITEEGEFEYEFRKDKTYSVISSGKIESNGNWEWNNDENCIYFKDEYGDISGKVVNIERERITLIPTSVIGENPQLEIVKYFYIPK